MSDETTAIVAVLGGIALFTTVLSIVAVRVRKAGDAQSLALRASDVVAQTGDLLVGPGFFWAVWQKTTALAEMTLLIRNDRDEVVSTVVKPNVVLDGVLMRFDLDGTRYEICKPTLMTNRTHLHAVGQDNVLLSAEHTTFTTTFFRGDGTAELCTVPSLSALTRALPVRVADREIGKLIIGLRQDSTTRILTLPDDRYSRLEQLFLLAS